MTTEPTDAELKAMWQLHAADIGGIFCYARAVLAKWGQPAQQAPAGAADANYHLIDRFLRINLYDDDYAEYSAALDALASTPAQPAPAPMSPANRLVAYSAATRLRELGFEWDATAEAWLQPAPSAQAADSVQEDAARYQWLTADLDMAHGRVQRNQILDRMPTMSYSAACTAIDAAMKEANHD